MYSMQIGREDSNYGVPMGGVKPSSGTAPLPTIQGATIQFLGHGHFLITLDDIVQTGSDVTTLLHIPFAHELKTLIVKHLDSSKTDSNDAMTTSFHHRMDNVWFNMWTITAGTASDTYGKFTDTFHLPAQYQIISNTTITDILKIQMEVYVMEY